MFVLSRKTKVSVERRIAEIMEGRFTESAVKELLIDLRELARQIPTGTPEAPPQFDKSFIHFIEICDFVAHSNRDRGVIETNVREHAERIAAALAGGGDQDWLTLTAVKQIIHADGVVAGMLGTAQLFLLSFNESLQRDYLIPAFERKDEIALCIISLLQDAIIRLKGNHGFASLHVQVYEGQYRLYCSILGSRMERDARQLTGGSGSVVFGFPVIDTGAKDLDGILSLRTRNSFMLPPGENIPLPSIVETYRETDGSLHVRVLD